MEATLLVPAVMFLTAVGMRELRVMPYGARYFAEQLVGWYAARIWTLWVLLLALPLVVLVTGCALLLRSLGHQVTANALPGRSKATRLFVGSTTVTAGVILAIVVLHMLAN
jgi:hypothetical protein